MLVPSLKGLQWIAVATGWSPNALACMQDPPGPSSLISSVYIFTNFTNPTYTLHSRFTKLLKFSWFYLVLSYLPESAQTVFPTWNSLHLLFFLENLFILSDPLYWMFTEHTSNINHLFLYATIIPRTQLWYCICPTGLQQFVLSPHLDWEGQYFTNLCPQAPDRVPDMNDWVDSWVDEMEIHRSATIPVKLMLLLLQVCVTAFALGLGVSVRDSQNQERGAHPLWMFSKLRSFPLVNSSCPLLLLAWLYYHEFIAVFYSPLVTSNLKCKLCSFLWLWTRNL